MKRRVIAVLMGGVSEEREVSLKSGREVVRALEELGHGVIPVEVRTDSGAELDGLRCDVAFLALHGRFGEDGEVQRLLEKRGILFTGSGAEASRLAMDKLESKRVFARNGIRTPAHHVVSRGDGPDLIARCAGSLGYPLVVKPRAQGSSIGVSVHRDHSTLLEGVEDAFRFGPVALLERFVAGREMTVGILDGRALPVIELKPSRPFFDYAAKYEDPQTLYLIDPPISQLDKSRIQKVALDAHAALGCDGFSRVDLIFTPLHEIFVLESNTIPGLTPRSLLPQAARAVGIDFPTLCHRIVESALGRGRRWRGIAAAVL